MNVVGNLSRAGGVKATDHAVSSAGWLSGVVAKQTEAEDIGLGITIDQGLERMFERMPLSEVSFLGIVINIQSKSGGNLSEALGNLSRVLRDRKKLKAKIRSMSQEAKSSAAIIGSLPFLIIGALLLISPQYLEPLFSTSTGHLIIGCSALWMLAGVFVMRGMINFDI